MKPINWSKSLTLPNDEMLYDSSFISLSNGLCPVITVYGIVKKLFTCEYVRASSTADISQYLRLRIIQKIIKQIFTDTMKGKSRPKYAKNVVHSGDIFVAITPNM